jgi:hypothetical protein
MNRPYPETFVSPSKTDGGLTLAVSVPSFPHAFSGNPGEFRTGPPIKTFGGDELGFRAEVSSSGRERELMYHFVVTKLSPEEIYLPRKDPKFA